MNSLFHFLLAFLVVELAFGNAQEYLIIIAVSSVFLDLDHIRYVFRNRKGLTKTGLGAECRTRFHELFGLALFGGIIVVGYFVFPSEAVQVVGVSLILHMSSDFLVGRTRPFYPYDKMTVHLMELSRKQRWTFEILGTTVMGVVVWLVL